METLKYKVITSEKQYDRYSATLEELVFSDKKSKAIKEEISLLTLLIKTWDEEHRDFDQLDPIELIHSLMEDHQLKAIDLANILGIGKSHMSEILNYKKGLSKQVIQQLAIHFKLSQEAFNRSYPLTSNINAEEGQHKTKSSGGKTKVA